MKAIIPLYSRIIHSGGVGLQSRPISLRCKQNQRLNIYYAGLPGERPQSGIEAEGGPKNQKSKILQKRNL